MMTPENYFKVKEPLMIKIEPYQNYNNTCTTVCQWNQLLAANGVHIMEKLKRDQSGLSV